MGPNLGIRRRFSSANGPLYAFEHLRVCMCLSVPIKIDPFRRTGAMTTILDRFIVVLIFTGGFPGSAEKTRPLYPTVRTI